MTAEERRAALVERVVEMLNFECLYGASNEIIASAAIDLALRGLRALQPAHLDAVDRQRLRQVDGGSGREDEQGQGGAYRHRGPGARRRRRPCPEHGNRRAGAPTAA